MGKCFVPTGDGKSFCTVEENQRQWTLLVCVLLCRTMGSSGYEKYPPKKGAAAVILMESITNQTAIGHRSETFNFPFEYYPM